MPNLLTRGLYAVVPNGSVFLLFREEKSYIKNAYTTFMQLPDLYEVSFEDAEDFSEFLKFKTLDFVEQLPQDVYDVCVANANKLF
jgi:hypothetical protein